MTRTGKKRRVKEKIEATPERALTSALYGVAVSAICAIALMLLFATIAIFMKDPSPISRIGGYLSLYISGGLGGFFAYRKCGGYALLSGLFTGVAYFVLTLLLSMLLPLSMSMGLSIILRIALIGATIGGAYLGAYRPTPRRRRRRK